MRRLPAALAAALLLGAAGCSRAAPVSAVSEQSGREVLAPTRFGWLSSDRPSGDLPSAIAVGGKASGRVLLYFEFPEQTGPRRLLRAVLLLDASGTPGNVVDVELSRAAQARGELKAWSDQPRALYPRVAAQLAAQSTPVRLDVTELLKAQNKPGQPLCLLLRAEPAGAAPLLIETGAAGGAAPRLETYWE
jgi:hypothetical protein